MITEELFTNLEKADEWKKRIAETSIHISNIPKEVKTRFMELAKSEFKNDYALTLKWLLDYRDGLLTSPNEELASRIDLIAEEFLKIKSEMKKEKPEDKGISIKTASGRILNIRRNGRNESGRTD